MLDCLAVFFILFLVVLSIAFLCMLGDALEHEPHSLRTVIYWLIHDTVGALGIFPAIYRWLTGPGPKIKRDKGDKP